MTLEESTWKKLCDYREKLLLSGGGRITVTGLERLLESELSRIMLDWKDEILHTVKVNNREK